MISPGPFARPRIRAAEGLAGMASPLLLSLVLPISGCEDPGSAPRPSAVSDSGPATAAGAAKRSAEQLEERIGDYQQQLLDQMDAAKGTSRGETSD